MEAYLEDNRPTTDEVCESYDECNKECPLYRLCHSQAENKPQESEDNKCVKEFTTFG